MAEFNENAELPSNFSGAFDFSGLSTGANEEGFYNASSADLLESLIAMFISPIVILLGLIGNILNIMILSKKRAKASSAMTLLCCLSVMDALVLVVQLPYVAMAYLDYNTSVFAANAFYVCYIRYPLTNVGLSAIAWLSGAVSIDRFASIMNMQSLRRFLKHHARAEAITIVVVSCFLNSSRIFHFQPVDAASAQQRTSGYLGWTRRIYCKQTALIDGTIYGSVSNYFSGILNTALPTGCMTVFGGIIIVKLLKLRRQRRVLFQQYSTSSAHNDDAAPGESNEMDETQIGLTAGSERVLEQNAARTGEESQDSVEQKRTLAMSLYKHQKSRMQNRFERIEKRISLATKMVIATIFLFLLSGLPSLFLTTASAIFGRSIYQYNAINCLKHISNLLIFINTSFCFALYCCTCSKYRVAVRRLFRRNRRRCARSHYNAAAENESTRGECLTRIQPTNGRFTLVHSASNMSDSDCAR